MGSDKESEQLVGCIGVCLTLTITTPMWLILLFALMQANDMPVWAWVLFWCYVPAQVLSVIVMSVAKTLLRG